MNEGKLSFVFVPSKGRPANSTCKLLNLASVQHVVVVEPQEVVDYKLAGISQQLVLPESNRGIGFVRNFILAKARELSLTHFWMLDDDIQEFYRVQNSRLVKETAFAVLSGAEAGLRRVSGLAQGALEYAQFAWSSKKDLAFLSYCDVAVWVNVAKTAALQYRPELGGKEDRDFTLQCLAAGHVTARAQQFAFRAPKNGSNKGGLHDFYSSGKEAEASRRMVEAWPGICSLHNKKDGRPDVKINWKAFRPK